MYVVPVFGYIFGMYIVTENGIKYMTISLSLVVFIIIIADVFVFAFI